VGPLKRAAGFALLPFALPLVGCYVRPHTAGAERAIELYREGRRSSGAISFRTEKRNGGAAPTAEPLPSQLDVDSAIGMAKKNSAKLDELRARVEVAKAEVLAKGKWRNPELVLTQTRLDQVLAGDPRVRAVVRFRPERPGEIDAKRAEASALARATEEAARAEEMTIEADVRWLFDDILLLDAEIAASEAVAAARRSLAERMKVMLGTAEATALDEAMAELSLVDAEADCAEQTSRRSLAVGQLLDLLGADPHSEVKLVGDAKSSASRGELPSERALVEAALRSRPEIGVAAANIDAAGARVSIERGQRYPWLTFLDGGYLFAPNVQPGLGFVFQMGVELPLLDTNRGGFAAAEAAENAARRALAAEVEAIARDVRDKLRTAEAARVLWMEMERRALPVAERAGIAAEKSLSGQHIDAIRALAVDERRVLAELRVLRLLRRYRLALADLRRAVGGRLPMESRDNPRAAP